MSVAAFGDVTLTRQGHVALVVFSRPPSNFFDIALIRDIAAALEAVDAERELRAVVLASEGASFCAGANFSGTEGKQLDPRDLYREALRIFSARKPVVAAVQGPAIGGGMGLALAADFRVVSAQTRFSANFVKVGIHPGFGLTLTLPRAVGAQKAALLLYTGRRIGGEEAMAMGVADMLVEPEAVRERALALATDIAEGAPLAVQATRATLRAGLVEALAQQVDAEGHEQVKLFATADFQEGVRAVKERRPGQWSGT